MAEAISPIAVVSTGCIQRPHPFGKLEPKVEFWNKGLTIRFVELPAAVTEMSSREKNAGVSLNAKFTVVSVWVATKFSV